MDNCQEKLYKVSIGSVVLAEFFGTLDLYCTDCTGIMYDTDYVIEFTENEIKAYDLKLWLFAEEVKNEN